MHVLVVNDMSTHERELSDSLEDGHVVRQHMVTYQELNIVPAVESNITIPLFATTCTLQTSVWYVCVCT